MMSLLKSKSILKFLNIILAAINPPAGVILFPFLSSAPLVNSFIKSLIPP